MLVRTGSRLMPWHIMVLASLLALSAAFVPAVAEASHQGCTYELAYPTKAFGSTGKPYVKAFTGVACAGHAFVRLQSEIIMELGAYGSNNWVVAKSVIVTENVDGAVSQTVNTGVCSGGKRYQTRMRWDLGSGYTQWYYSAIRYVSCA